MNFGLQTASNWTCILPTLHKFYIPLHCQASHTEVSKRNSTKLCQTVNSKSRQQFAIEKLQASLPIKLGGQKLLHLLGFSTTSRLMANIFGMKQDIDNRVKALKTTRRPLYHPKISWTLVHKPLKIRPEFLRTLGIPFCPQYIAHPLSERL